VVSPGVVRQRTQPFDLNIITKKKFNFTTLLVYDRKSWGKSVTPQVFIGVTSALPIWSIPVH
jgi:hypothetical protein